MNEHSKYPIPNHVIVLPKSRNLTSYFLKHFSFRFGSLFDPTPLPSEEKSSTSTTNTNTATSSSKPKSRFGSLFDDDNSSKTESKPSENDSVDVKSDEAKTAAGDKIAVTKVYDFAGEIVKVTKEVDANSKEAKKFLESSSTRHILRSIDPDTFNFRENYKKKHIFL